MKVIISVFTILVVSIASSCSSHSSCPAYSDSNEKGMKFEKSNTQEITDLEIKNA